MRSVVFGRVFLSPQEFGFGRRASVGEGTCGAVLWIVFGEGGVGIGQIRVLCRALHIPPRLPRISLVGRKATSQLRVNGWLQGFGLFGFGFCLFSNCLVVFGCRVIFAGAWLNAFSCIADPGVPFCNPQ